MVERKQKERSFPLFRTIRARMVERYIFNYRIRPEELKRRLPAPWSAVDRVNGCVDSWTKWSFAHETLTQVLDPMRQDGQWIRIAKDRWLRKMTVDGGKPAFVVPSEQVKSGCNFELTRVFIDNDRKNPKQAWSTICFEAFGPELDRTRVILDACAKLAFADLGIPPKVELTERTSLSYPAWFATLGR